MNLEDSIGDILRKARISTQTPAEVAAELAGLAREAYEQLESTGQAPAGIQWAPLARRLTLDAGRLAAQHDGWRPGPARLDTWRQLRVFTTAGDDMTVNCFLAWDEATREAVLFDTGFSAAPVLEQIDAAGLALRHVLITHSHGDHVAALGEVRARFPGARIHSGSAQAPAEHRLRRDEGIQAGCLRITHRETPGHAEDGITYVVAGWPGDAPLVAVVGDALFAGSIGGARENLALARRRIRDAIFSLPADTLVCPGHGPVTTVGEEMAHNPWFPAGE
ncbi:MAG: MBL fold metallo-hydrolase [Verrucomicrobiota bacterium]